MVLEQGGSGPHKVLGPQTCGGPQAPGTDPLDFDAQGAFLIWDPKGLTSGFQGNGGLAGPSTKKTTPMPPDFELHRVDHFRGGN